MGCQCCGPPPPSPGPTTALPEVEVPTPVSTSNCQDSCCDDPENVELLNAKTQNDADAPDCCRGKVAPCCDSSCLDRLAARECGMSSTAATPCAGTTVDGKPCSQHGLSALDRYGATLRALGCICRSLIALGQETCCEIRNRHSLDGDKQQVSRQSSSSARSSLRATLDSCTKSVSIDKDQATGNRTRLQSALGEIAKSPKEKPSAGICASGCCSGDNPAKLPPPDISWAQTCCSSDNLESQQVTQPAPNDLCCLGGLGVNDNDTGITGADSCCAKAEPPRAASDSCCGETKKTVGNFPKTSCAKSCCTENQWASPQDSCADACCSTVPGPDLEIENVPTQAITDVENRIAGKQHIILSISGMTCTGCETKLSRTLAAVPAVKNLKTSLVLARAEFELDLCLGSADEVINHLERTTEFKCERIQNQGSSLDLFMSGGLADFVSQTWPDGIIDMTPLDKHTVRVAFDPKIVGARDLVEEIWGPPIGLAPPHGDVSLKAGSKHVRHVGYITLLSAVLTIPVLVMAWAPLPGREVAYSSASLALATIVQVAIAGPFYPKALKALVFSRVIEMDLLIVLSTSAAYIFSVVSFGYLMVKKPLSTGQFFETSTLLVTLIMVGRWFAALARQKAVESISIRSLQTSIAILVDRDSGEERAIDSRLLQYGDVFRVLPDTRIPTDGTVLTGSSEVDESMLTGESMPVEKYTKSVVIAGSINGPGVMTVQLSRLPSDNTITTIAAMVDEAKLSKPKLQDLADRIASYFVPVVVALTIVTFAIWVAVGVAVLGYTGSEATIQAITYAITVLIVSCPCAIGLAVPMVVVISSGVAAKRGVIFKSADAIEVAHKTSHVVFDKTGTLTRGRLSVVANECMEEGNLPLLLGLVENSRHPVSTAVTAHLKDRGVVSSTVPELKSLTGKGLEANFGGKKFQAGNSRWLSVSNHDVVQPMLAQGYTVFCFTIDNVLQAVFGLEDELRADSAATVHTLLDRGVSVHIVSGDDDGAVKALASKLSISHDNVRSRSSPADKKDYVQTLLGTSTDDKKPVVVFCGDGTNDAVALAQATIGVHMNEGTDVAQSAADVVLLRPSLAGILTMMNASRKSVNRINFNFMWSAFYNIFAVLLAAGAFVHARIPPEFAGLGELVSVLPVIAAAVLLHWSEI